MKGISLPRSCSTTSGRRKADGSCRSLPPLYDKFGPRVAYGRLLQALKSIDFHTINELRIRVVGTREPLMRGLRRAYAKDRPSRGVASEDLPQEATSGSKIPTSIGSSKLPLHESRP